MAPSPIQHESNAKRPLFVANKRNPLQIHHQPLSIRHPSSSISHLKISLCFGALLNNTLDDRLGSIPIVGIKPNEINLEVFCNLFKGLVTRPVKNEANADSHSSKSASPTDSVKICLEIRLRVTPSLHWNVVIDDHRDRLHINTPSQNISCDKNLSLTTSEVL
jgi:hypothetical protein